MMSKTPPKPWTVQDITYIAVFAALIAVCSWISIPTAIPFTLQTLGVFLAVGMLGGRRGTAAVVVYLLLGAAGLPVFAGFTGGLGILFGYTSGYFLGFLLSALLMWGLERLWGREMKTLAAGMLLSLPLVAPDLRSRRDNPVGGPGGVCAPLHPPRPREGRRRIGSYRPPAPLCQVNRCTCGPITGCASAILPDRATARRLPAIWQRFRQP